MHKLRSQKAAELLPVIEPAAIEGLKFSGCLPSELATHVLQMRDHDPAAVAKFSDRQFGLCRNKPHSCAARGRSLKRFLFRARAVF